MHAFTHVPPDKDGVSGMPGNTWFTGPAQRVVGPLFAGYRLGFNVLAVLTFVLAGLLAPRLPQTLYEVAAPWSWLLRLVQALGLGLFLWTFAVIDGREFLGLRQVRERAGQRPPPLVQNGPYALCRHPMYLAGYLILFATPRMSLEHLLFSLFAAVYLLVGSVFEERRLVRDYGDAYVQYRHRTARIFPLSFLRKVVERGPSHD